MKPLFAIASILGLTLMISPTSGLRAAELDVIAGGSLTGLLNELGPQFERTSGHRLTIHFDSTPNIIAQITTETPFDLAVVPGDVFKNASAKAHFAPSPLVDIARVGYGIAVRAGAPKPDIGTPDALKKTLLDARSIVTVPASAAGAYVLKVFERLGIAEAMKAKTVAKTAPAHIVPAVVHGEAELGIFLNNVLMASGVDLVGPFPAELQQDLVFTAGISAHTRQADVAKAFIDFLTTPAATALIKAQGLNPG
jgi:molybdate transport system substrate-binding protein